MTGLLLTPAALANAAERALRDLHSRLEQLNQAPALTKLHHARFVAAAFFELEQHQTHFNQSVAEELAALRSQFATLRADLSARQAPPAPGGA